MYLFIYFCKVAEKEVKTGRAGELSQGRPGQGAESWRRSGCSSSLRACGVQVARAASGGRRREEGGELGGEGGSVESGPGFAGSPRAAFRAPAPAGARRRRRRRQRRRSLSGDVEAAALAAAEAAAAARAGAGAEREERQDLVPRSRAPRPSPAQPAPSHARRLLSPGASRCALRQPRRAALGGD